MRRDQWIAVATRIEGVRLRLQEAKIAAQAIAASSVREKTEALQKESALRELEMNEALARAETWLIALREEISSAKRQDELMKGFIG